MNNLQGDKQIKSYTNTYTAIISNRLLTEQSLAAATLTTVNMPVVETPNNTLLYNFTTNANAITIKKAGKYSVVFSLWMYSSGGSPTDRYFEFYKNGSDKFGIYTAHQTSAVNPQFSGSYECVINCVVGDYIYVKAYCNVISNLGATGYDSNVMPALTLNYLEN